MASLSGKHGEGAPFGISVLICSHNGAARLPETLRHLAAQSHAEGIQWEVLIVDNASSDNTAQAALREWPASHPAPLRVVSETRPGLVYARQRGLRESRYEFVSFVDDDNWVAEDWIKRVFAILSTRDEVAACGGFGIPAFEQAPPAWFERFSSSYALGPQEPAEGYVSIARGYLFGAGLTIRKAAWLNLISQGFRSILVGRKGESLGSGEDGELCLACLAGGWKLWYDPGLVYRHFIPSTRLSWSYLLGIMRGFGLADVWLEVYRHKLTPPPLGSFRRTWVFHAYTMARTLGSMNLNLWKRRGDPALEGSVELAGLVYQMGRAEGLIRNAVVYDWRARSIYSLPRAEDRG